MLLDERLDKVPSSLLLLLTSHRQVAPLHGYVFLQQLPYMAQELCRSQTVVVNFGIAVSTSGLKIVVRVTLASKLRLLLRLERLGSDKGSPGHLRRFGATRAIQCQFWRLIQIVPRVTCRRLKSLYSLAAGFICERMTVDCLRYCLPGNTGSPQLHLAKPDTVGQEIAWV